MPLARFAAQHIGELGTPFKRYHIAHGLARRETRSAAATASSCSAISTRSAPRSIAADIETALVIHDLLMRIGVAFGAIDFTIRVNNRAVLTACWKSSAWRTRATAILRALDKLARSAAEKVADEMVAAAGATAEQAGAGLASWRR